MGGRIDCYVDIASFYSYIALVHILKNKHLFDQHSIEIEIHPVLIGAIVVGSGNKPPWTVPAKAAHFARDVERAKRAAGLPTADVPGDLIGLARTQVALRALHDARARLPAAAYLAVLLRLFEAFWVPGADLTSAAAVAEALRGIPSASPSVSPSPDPGPGPGPGPDPGRAAAGAAAAAAAAAAASAGGGGATEVAAAKAAEAEAEARPLLTPAQVDEVLRAAGSRACRDALTRSTDEALRRGAFGCPWLWVTDGEGRAEAFFGSDRWNHIYEFLGLPYQDLALLPPPTGAAGGGRAKL